MRRARISTELGCRFDLSVPLGIRCRAVGSGISRPRNRPRERIQTGQPAPWSHAGRMDLYSVDDVVKLRDTPGVVDKTILAVTQQDGRGVRVRIEQQIGTGGVFQDSAYIKLFAGYDYAGRKPTGEKPTRWRGLSVQAEGGNVWLSEGAWNDEFVRELCDLPGRHDDQADAAAGAFNEIAAGYSVQIVSRRVGWWGSLIARLKEVILSAGNLLDCRDGRVGDRLLYLARGCG